MKKYHVYGKIAASKYLGEFEAKSKEDAIDKGWEVADIVTLCHHCSKEVEIGDMYELEADEVEE